MKRLIVVVLAIGLLTGIALSAQKFVNHAFASTTQITSTVGAAPLPSIPEPVTIVLSSLVLLGSTTLLLRRRRRAIGSQVEAKYSDANFASLQAAVSSR